MLWANKNVFQLRTALKTEFRSFGSHNKCFQKDVLYFQQAGKKFVFLTWVDIFSQDPELWVVLKSHQTALLDAIYLRETKGHLKKNNTSTIKLRVFPNLDQHNPGRNTPFIPSNHLLFSHFRGTEVRRSIEPTHRLLRLLYPSWGQRTEDRVGGLQNSIYWLQTLLPLLTGRFMSPAPLRQQWHPVVKDESTKAG